MRGIRVMMAIGVNAPAVAIEEMIASAIVSSLCCGRKGLNWPTKGKAFKFAHSRVGLDPNIGVSA